MRRRQRFQELSIRLADAIIHLVSRSPERVPTCLGQLDQPETGKVRRCLLKRDIAMPDRRHLRVCRVLVERLASFRVDRANLRVWVAEFATVVRDGMDMESVRRGTAGKLSHAEDEGFLQLVGQIILGAEEHDATFGN